MMNGMNRRHFLALTGAATASAQTTMLDGTRAIGYVGTYTRGASKGIYSFHWDTGTGKVTELGLAAEIVNPSFVALHPSGKFLYSVSEVGDFGGQPSGAVTGFSRDVATGKLTKLNTVATKGTSACHLACDHTGRMLVVTNYGTGSVASFGISKDGQLSEAVSFIEHKGSSVNPARQKGPHAHSVNISPDNRYAIVADLGLDQVLVYRIDPKKATLTAHTPPFAKVPAGGGPRHFTFHPAGKFAYALNEIGSSVTVFDWDGKHGVLTEKQTTTTLPPDFKGVNSCAEVLAHKSGKFLYASNRGHDTIAYFGIDKDGKLTLNGHVPAGGKTPRNFGFDGTGNYVFAATQSSANVEVFQVDDLSGRLVPTGTRFSVDSPVCVRFDKQPSTLKQKFKLM